MSRPHGHMIELELRVAKMGVDSNLISSFVQDIEVRDRLHDLVDMIRKRLELKDYRTVNGNLLAGGENSWSPNRTDEGGITGYIEANLFVVPNTKRK